MIVATATNGREIWPAALWKRVCSLPTG